MVVRFENVLEVRKEGMFIGVSVIPECWKNPMEISVFMAMEEGKNE